MENLLYTKDGKRIAKLIMNLSQEFSTPLGLILSPLEQVLEDSTLSQESYNRLQLVYRNSVKFRKLIDQLFDISKILTGSPVIQLQKSDLVSFIKALSNSFEDAAAKKEVSINFQSNLEELECLFDYQKVQRVLYTLLANAIRFNRKEGTVFISINHVPGQKYISVKVSDTGIGIVPEKIPHVFNPFYDKDETHLRLYQSTHLGLYLAKLLVENLHGSIEVESEKDMGTSFTVLLPFIRNMEEVNYRNYTFKEDFRPERMQETEKVVDVDTEAIIDVNLLGSTDKPVVLMLTGAHGKEDRAKEVLRKHYRILEAVSPKEAHVMGMDHDPALIVTSDSYTQTDPLELISFFKDLEETAHIPIMLTVNLPSEQDEIEALNRGADVVLPTNTSNEKILALAQNLIDNRNKTTKWAEEATREKLLEIKSVSLEEAFINRVNAVIQKHMDNEKFNMKVLSDELYMSRTQIHRKLKNLTNMSTTQYVRAYKLERAHRDIEQRLGTISEIAYRYGFSSPAYFTRIFKEHFGYTPSDVKYNKDLNGA